MGKVKRGAGSGAPDGMVLKCWRRDFEGGEKITKRKRTKNQTCIGEKATSLRVSTQLGHRGLSNRGRASRIGGGEGMRVVKRGD